MEKLLKNRKLIFIVLGGIIAGSALLLFILNFVSSFVVESSGALALTIICQLLTALMLVSIGAIVGMFFLDKSFKDELRLSIIAYAATLGALVILLILILIFSIVNIHAGQFFNAIRVAIEIPFLLTNGFALTCVIKSFLIKNDNKSALMKDISAEKSEVNKFDDNNAVVDAEADIEE